AATTVPARVQHELNSARSRSLDSTSRFACQKRRPIAGQAIFAVASKNFGPEADFAQYPSQVGSPVEPQSMGFFRAPIMLVTRTAKRSHMSCQNHPFSILFCLQKNRPVGSREIANARISTNLSRLSDVEDEQASRSQRLVDARKQFLQLCDT